jgi:hypothetical protein
MAAGSTYSPISSQTLSSAVSSVTFSSIPSTYTDLVVVFNGSNSVGNDSYVLQLNGVTTGSLYSGTYMEGDGSTAYSSNWQNLNYIPVARGGSSTAGADIIIMNINNYANTSFSKTVLARYSLGGTVGARTSETIGLYRSTTAISSVTFKSGSGNIAIGSTITLYGIAAA